MSDGKCPNVIRAAACLIGFMVAMSCTKSYEPGSMSCDERMKRFEAQLALATKTPSAGIEIPAAIAPVESTKGRPADRHGPVLVVEARGAMTFNGETMTRIEPDLRDRLGVEAKLMRMTERSAPLYVWADRATPAALVAQIVAIVPKDFEPRFLLAGPLPARSAYGDELMRDTEVSEFRRDVPGLDPAEKAVLIARNFEKAIGTCAPLIKAFGEIAAMDASQKGSFLADASPRAVRECKCKVTNIDLLEYLMLTILGAYERTVTWIPAAQAASVLPK